MKKNNNQAWLLTWACWAFLFTPALFEGLSAASVGLWLAASFLFWPLALWRPLLLPVLALLLGLGALNIVHVGFFGNLADQIFLATALRTNREEMREFLGVLPWPWVGLAALWLVCALMAARQLWRAVPAVRACRLPRRLAWVALLIWMGFTALALVRGHDFDQVVRKLKTLYPMHIVRAWTAQSDLTQSMFYQPRLPQRAASAAQVDTLVVVLGESASAQRWSMLGYEGADTNAPLKDVEGVQAVRAMAHGLNTAATLPYLLTGLTAEESVQRRAASFLDMARQAGYKIFVISNSRYHSSVEDFYGVMLRRAADVFLKAANGAWDEVLTPHLQVALEDPAPRKLVLLHTYGSHSQVEERYPAAQAPFQDAYDNSLHYTSRLLADWIRMLEHSAGDQRSAMLLYASDHGVAMPPCADEYRTGKGLSSLQVPLMVWSNPALRQRLAGVLPDFSDSERLHVRHSNAVLAELAASAVGYPQALALTPDSAAKRLMYQGHSWDVLQKLDACTLQ